MLSDMLLLHDLTQLRAGLFAHLAVLYNLLTLLINSLAVLSLPLKGLNSKALHVFYRLLEYLEAVCKRDPFASLDKFLRLAINFLLVGHMPQVNIYVIHSKSGELFLSIMDEGK